jgi:hypothetical protein
MPTASEARANSDSKFTMVMEPAWTYLRTSGAEKVSFIAVCVDKPEVANKIVELVKAEFRQARAFG